MSSDSVLTNYKGQVKITGKIYIKNRETYNGSGIKDADTIHINTYPDSVSFRPSLNEGWKTNLKVLNDCYFMSDFNGLSKIIYGDYSSLAIRLQGCDASELHYRAIQNDVKLDEQQQKKFNEESKINYRQKWSGISTNELFTMLRDYFHEEGNKTFVNVYMLSMVDKPSDLFDKFGRAIGDVYISDSDRNINQWLVKNGWAFHDFYNSMSKLEIQELKTIGTQAFDQSSGIMENNSYSKELVPFDSTLIFDHNHPEIDLTQDKGKINLPKFFRKQVDYEILKKCGMSYTTLKNFISSMNRRCYKTEEVLRDDIHAQSYSLSDFMLENDSITVKPGDLINIESPSQLLDETGRPLGRDEWY